MAKKILKNLHLTVDAKVLLKLTLSIWEYFCTTSFTLYLATNLSL